MDLEGLRGFLAIIDSGSFAAAASSLRWSRATLRRRIDELESVAGVRLLSRSGHGASPTDAGTQLAERGREVLAQAASAISSVRELGDSPTGLIRVLAPVGLPPIVKLAVLMAGRERHAGMRAVVRFSDDPLEDLHKGVDLAFMFGDRPTSGAWVTREIARFPMRLLATAAYLKKRGTPKRVTDLARHDLLMWLRPGESGTVLPLVAGGKYEVTPTVATSDVHFLRELAAQGGGIVWAPDAGVQDVAEELLPVLEDEIAGECPMRVLMGAESSPKTRAVLALLNEFLPNVAKGF